MTNNKTIGKYDILYQSIAEFAFRIGLCKRDELEGAVDERIASFCDKHNVTIPPALWSYTRHYGRRARVRDTDYNCAYSIADYDYALHQASLREEWNDGMNVKELLKAKNFKVNYDDDYPSDNIGLYTPEIRSLMDIDDIFIFHYDPFSRAFKFIDSSEENPSIYYFTRYTTLTSVFSSFTNRFRDLQFMYIVNHAPQDFAEIGMVDGKRVPISAPPVIDYSDGFDCIRTYQELLKNKNINRGELKHLREGFYLVNDEIEVKENRVLSFTEFENSFIDYLKEHNFDC